MSGVGQNMEPKKFDYKKKKGEIIAQLVEHSTDNRTVSGSIPLDLNRFIVDHSKIFYLLYIIITKNNLKISITNLKGEVVFKKSQGMLKGIRRGSINSADASLIMMNQISDDLRGFNIKYLGIYLKGATR